MSEKKQIAVQSFRNGVMKVVSAGDQNGRVLTNAEKADIFGKEKLPNDPINPNDPDAITGVNTVNPVEDVETNDPNNPVDPITPASANGRIGFDLPENFDSLLVDDLKKLAAEHDVNLDGVTLKDDIKAKIKAASEGDKKEEE